MYEETIFLFIGALFLAPTLFFGGRLLVLHRRNLRFHSLKNKQISQPATSITPHDDKPPPEDEPSLSFPSAFVHNHCARATQLLIEYDGAAPSLSDGLFAPPEPCPDILEGKYVLGKELPGAGLSRVYLAKHAKLGNDWIVKFVPKELGPLREEGYVLKDLSHVGLPKIVDIFHDDRGSYLVEAFIEGPTLYEAVQKTGPSQPSLILDWAIQLAQILDYLHNRTPRAIHHLDVNPSNIILTHDNRLVLVDFGLSQHGADGAPAALTYAYAAPEQFRGPVPPAQRALVESRFGSLEKTCLAYPLDERTDIYGCGAVLFFLATGVAPTQENKPLLWEVLPPDLARLIETCLAFHPDERFASCQILLSHLRKIQFSRIGFARLLFRRKLAVWIMVSSALLSMCGFFTGAYVYWRESNSALFTQPANIVLSVGASAELHILKRAPDGGESELHFEDLTWHSSSTTISSLQKGRVFALAPGESDWIGLYRDSLIRVQVHVVDSVSDRPPLSLWVLPEIKENRLPPGDETYETTLKNALSVDVDADGRLYAVADNTVFRVESGTAAPVPLPDGLTPRLVRTVGQDLYVLARRSVGVYDACVLLKLSSDGVHEVTKLDNTYITVYDFDVAKDGTACFLEYNHLYDMMLLVLTNPSATTGPASVERVIQLPDGVSSLAVGFEDNLYLADPTTGVILCLPLDAKNESSLRVLAGTENRRGYQDGSAPLFQSPGKIRAKDNFLYIWDDGLLRRLNLAPHGALDCLTLAGDLRQHGKAAHSLFYVSANQVSLRGCLGLFALSPNGCLVVDSALGELQEIYPP